uniref:unspecific monooxygenase n=1 Tax=Echeneis naucrates TaxID=173247 RepID=A0A665T932_ECHNA
MGIKGPRPLPFIGTFLEYRKGIYNFDTECFQKYGKVWGLYDGRLPVLVFMDTDIIKTILVKECYSVFTNRRDLGLNGPLYDAVSIAEDEKWKRIRSVLSPSFTSGRLKEVQKHRCRMCATHYLRFLLEKLHICQVFGPYSMDVVTSTAFSVDIDSINNPSDPFVTNIKKMVKFNFFNPLLVLTILFPFLEPVFNKMNLSFFPAEVMDFFYSTLEKIKSDRKKNDRKVIHISFDLILNVICSLNFPLNVFMCLLCGLTDHEILSQAMAFIFAGYETSSSTLCFLAYSLATNPHIQKTLQEEIDKTFPEKPTYEGLVQMEYLDMVMNESMRLYPIGNRLERIAKVSVEVNGVTIPKGTATVIPVYTLHRDPALWPEPEIFKPERFSKENKDNIDPYAFLPFGAGPRNCIGMRFALLMMKLAIVEVLQNFSIVTCKETDIPMVLANDGFTIPKNPIKLKLEPRASAADSN